MIVPGCIGAGAEQPSDLYLWQCCLQSQVEQAFRPAVGK
jgi:hypothetical protein